MRERIDKNPFYIAEFVQYQGDNVLLRIKGYRPKTYDDEGPYDSKYEHAWALKGTWANNPDAPRVIFQTQRPDLDRFEPIQLVTKCDSLLPLHAFSLTKGGRIPSAIKTNIQALLAHRAPE